LVKSFGTVGGLENIVTELDRVVGEIEDLAA
jgi:Mg2+/Co2+ transporter CorC